MKTANKIGARLFVYKTVDCQKCCYGFTFSFRADSREDADRTAAEKAKLMFAKAEFVKVI
jgi:hypothetical protein